MNRSPISHLPSSSCRNRRLRLLVAGISWPPETFLRRLIDGLVEAGVEVTVGSAGKPDAPQVKWLPTPSWDAPIPLRSARLVRMAIRALVCGPGDLKILDQGGRSSRRKEALNPSTHENRASSPQPLPAVELSSRLPANGEGRARRLQTWNRLLPYAGRRWDVIYFPWNSAAIACLPIFDLPSPVIVSCRGTQVSVAPHNPERAPLRDGLSATFQKAAAVHCVSKATLEDACRLGLEPARARVIHPAVDPDQFQPTASRSNDNSVFRVVIVGTLIWVKGHEWALQAIRRLVDQNIKVSFEIIGDGPDRQRVLYTVSDLGLEHHVKLLGKLPPEEVLRHVQQADAFLLSSLSEGISNAVLEAMACGLPVVTTDCGGMREAVTDGVEGFVVPVRNSGAMAAALERLARDRELRARMGKAGRERILKEFTLDRQIEQWLELLHAVLNLNSATADVSYACSSRREEALTIEEKPSAES